ncbi:MAG: hypothetical protein GEV08_24270 [Acidimicrobiia bacterium]|nr:hypothetical protein [Acidimicrobiia bacterium]
MKRSTAIRHLVEMSQVASDHCRLRESDIGWPLEELWVAGRLLETTGDVDDGTVVLLLDVPVDELSWLAEHPAGEWVGSQLRLGKRPMTWWYRPRLLPAWSHEHRRVVRVWTAQGGLDEGVIDALRSDPGALAVVEPSAAQLVLQAREELGRSRRHLREVLERSWDRDRRRDRSLPGSREDRLWRAAMAVSDLLDALDELDETGR